MLLSPSQRGAPLSWLACHPHIPHATLMSPWEEDTFPFEGKTWQLSLPAAKSWERGREGVIKSWRWQKEGQEQRAWVHLDNEWLGLVAGWLLVGKFQALDDCSSAEQSRSWVRFLVWGLWSKGFTPDPTSPQWKKQRRQEAATAPYSNRRIPSHHFTFCRHFSVD